MASASPLILSPGRGGQGLPSVPFDEHAATIGAFLRRLHAQRVVPIGPREYLAAERLLRTRVQWPETELRAALASLLSGSREEWAAVADAFDATFHPRSISFDARPPDRPEDAGEAQEVVFQPRPTREPTASERRRARRKAAVGRFLVVARNAHRGWWVAAIALLIAGILMLTVWPLVWTQAPTGAPDGTIELEPPETPDASGTFLKRLRPSETRSLPIPVSPPPESLGALASIALIGFVLGGLGVRLLGLPRAAEAARRSRADERRAAARARRKLLEEAQAASRELLRIRYYVPEWPALSRQGMLDSAELLGRLLREERGDEVAPLPTLRRTLAAGGCFTPVMRPRHVRQEVLLLVDTEQGDHPWLPGFLRLVDDWRRQGVRLLRFDFQFTPVSLMDPLSHETLQIEEAARRTEGLPLIIFSRGLRPASRTGEARWLQSLKYWPVRAWLDPDPRRLAERSTMRRREIDGLTRWDLGRFPLSAPGVVTMARWLAADGESPRAVDWDAGLAPHWTDGGEPLAEALRKWALAAALVPDPTWDQLESIRRHFPEIHGVLTDRRDLQRLLDWIGGQTGADVELNGGRCLNIPEQSVDQWIRNQRLLARRDPSQWGFEERVRRLLLAQLEPARPPEDQALELERWRLKKATHQALIGQGSARELLGWAFDAAVAHEASRWVRQELARHADGLASKPLQRSDLESLQVLDGIAEGVDIRALVRGHHRLWLRAVLALIPAMLVLVYDPDLFPFDRLANVHGAKTVEVAARLPAVFALETAGNWVALAGGPYRMGTEDGDTDERPVHAVTIKPFAMGRTEVTVAEYRLCFEAGDCTEPRTGSSCNWGVKERDMHPVNCVSWDQASTYAKWAGGRLPSESEWEYAARGQGLDRDYPWGNQTADCSRAVVDDGGVGCGRNGTWPVCSRPAGNTGQGLCDMAGNLWEWVEDDYHDSYEGAPLDGSAWVDVPRGSGRVVRGGSWGYSPRSARVAIRIRLAPGNRFDCVGFRLARSLPSGL